MGRTVYECKRKNGTVYEGRSYEGQVRREKSVRPEVTGIYRWPELLTSWMLTKECRVERNDWFGCCSFFRKKKKTKKQSQ